MFSPIFALLNNLNLYFVVVFYDPLPLYHSAGGVVGIGMGIPCLAYCLDTFLFHYLAPTYLQLYQLMDICDQCCGVAQLWRRQPKRAALAPQQRTWQ